MCGCTAGFSRGSPPFPRQVCEDYITEKAMRPYRLQLVPVFYEATIGGVLMPNYAQFFPPGSYVNAAAFRCPRSAGGEARAHAYNLYNCHVRSWLHVRDVADHAAACCHMHVIGRS